MDGSKSEMAKINEAYTILRNESEKAEYDKWYAEEFSAYDFNEENQERTNESSDNDYSNNQDEILCHYLFLNKTAIDPIYVEDVFNETSYFDYDYTPFLSKDNELYFITEYIKEKRTTKIVKENTWHFVLNSEQAKYENRSYFQRKIKPQLFSICNVLKNDKGTLFLGITLLILICMVLLGHYSDSDSSANRRYDDSEYYDEPIYEEEPFPEHNTVGSYKNHSPNLEIKTEDNSSLYYFLKVVDAQTDRTVQICFIHSGRTANIYVPPGTYKIRWVSGEVWYGQEHLFNNSTASEADDLFTFTSTSGWTLTLYPVTNGNLETETIDIEDF